MLSSNLGLFNPLTISRMTEMGASRLLTAITPKPSSIYPSHCKPTTFDAAPKYWKNQDRTLLEIHPELMGDLNDPEAVLSLLLDWPLDRPRQNLLTQNEEDWHKPQFAQEDDGPFCEEFCILPPGTVLTLRTCTPHTDNTTPITSGTTPFVVYQGTCH